MNKLTLSILVFVLFVFSCKKQTSNSTAKVETIDHCKDLDSKYSDVKPVFSANCVGCHTLPKAAAGIDLNTYETTSKLAKNGTLACVLKGESCKAMPPMKKLNESDLLKMICWIKNGSQQ